jgi:hypothetical protein
MSQNHSQKGARKQGVAGQLSERELAGFSDESDQRKDNRHSDKGGGCHHFYKIGDIINDRHHIGSGRIPQEQIDNNHGKDKDRAQFGKPKKQSL